jgi:3-hydroxyacyl-[acyl-carrier-protein] dehydratase
MALEEQRSFEIREIMKILPHRYPMLLVDRIVEFEPMRRAIGYKNLTINEEFFQGHFPNLPLMPGVLMIEALAQLGGTIIMSPYDYKRQTAVLTGIDKAKFRKYVVPGDRLDMEVTLLRTRSTLGWVSAVASVGGKPACSAELMFALTAIDDIGMDVSVLNQ